MPVYYKGLAVKVWLMRGFYRLLIIMILGDSKYKWIS